MRTPATAGVGAPKMLAADALRLYAERDELTPVRWAGWCDGWGRRWEQWFLTLILDPWLLNLNGQKQLPDGQKAHERMLNIVVTGETQIQATVRHPFTPIKMAITK